MVITRLPSQKTGLPIQGQVRRRVHVFCLTNNCNDTEGFLELDSQSSNHIDVRFCNNH